MTLWLALASETTHAVVAATEGLQLWHVVAGTLGTIVSWQSVRTFGPRAVSAIRRALRRMFGSEIAVATIEAAAREHVAEVRAEADVRKADITGSHSIAAAVLAANEKRLERVEARLDDCERTKDDCIRMKDECARQLRTWEDRAGAMDATYQETLKRAEECEKRGVENRTRIEQLERDVRRAISSPPGMPTP